MKMNLRFMTLGSVLCGVGLSLLLSVPALAYEFDGWSHGAAGYEECGKQALKDDSLMIVYFHTDWCGWCKKLDETYLADEQVSSFLEKLPKVEINPEKGDQENALAQKSGVKGYPTFLVMVPSAGTLGAQVHPFSKEGAMTAEQFVQEIQSTEAKIRATKKNDPAQPPETQQSPPDAVAVGSPFSKEQLGKTLEVQATVATVEMYRDGVWMEMRPKNNQTFWVVVNRDRFQEADPPQVGCTLSATGKVAKDRTGGGYMLDTRSGGTVKWNSRQESEEEKAATAMSPIPLADLESVAEGRWISVAGRVTLTEKQGDPDPEGLWVEIEDEGAKAGVWIEGTVFAHLGREIPQGKRVIAVGLYSPGEPPLKGVVNVVTPRHIVVIAE